MMNNTLISLKHTLENLKTDLSFEFSQNANITAVTRKLVEGIDATLIALFHKHGCHLGNHLCLLALGGYGRRELQLHSDIDLLILHDEQAPDSCLLAAERFIQDCWDIGLEVSHQITTVLACAELAANDISVISSVLDMHVLCGAGTLKETLRYKTHPLHMWASHDYFFAKLNEQQARYQKYNETAYNLEPNIKYGPGGLRDLHVLLAIGKRHFDIHTLADGVHHGFITEKEYEELIHCQHFLMRVRFALHMLAQKREDRLLFDYQIKLASLFGFQDTASSLAIEQFMKAYFKVIKRARELNEMLLQWFSETILYPAVQRVSRLDDSFQLSNQYIDVRKPSVFSDNPQAILKLFLWIATKPEIKGVRASTIRLVHQNLYLLTDKFCASTESTHTFMSILKSGNNPYEALQRMSQYGVLGHYLNAFAAVTGQMQYDLFHVYTVEQHTLFVIRNLARFNDIQFQPQFPLAAKLMPAIPKPEILYLAGLFHDISKGCGGDHSELGAMEAAAFAERHHLQEDEKSLLTWLVQNHLLMSKTAQREDIYDAKTITRFCSVFPENEYLDYLYLLTVADIVGTNPALWNTWKDSLLKELYLAASQAMCHEKTLKNEAALIRGRRQDALNILEKDGVDASTTEALWHDFKNSYFLHESAESIAHHTKAILSCTEYPLVLIMPHHSLSGTEVFIYMPHREDRFTITTAVLSNHRVTIQDATILTCNNQFDLDTYIILDEHNQAMVDAKQIESIQTSLTTHLKDRASLPSIIQRRISRTQAHFNISPQITYTKDQERKQTGLFLVTSDSPGLLASISQVFLEQKIHLHRAKIATAGERVEDMFFISNQEDNVLTKEEESTLRQALILNGLTAK